ncbi:MAG: hydrogenase maturation protein HypF, partial [Eggerthellaceae bacterium]
QASATGMPLVQVQHHHAHILSVMGENGIEGPVAGFAFDGTGYGLDGAIWGGEVLLSNLKAYERFANFAYIPLPGGAAAIKNPARIAYGALWAFDLLDHPAAQAFVKDQVSDAEVLGQMIDRGLNTPETSSVGRLFDAASALLGICTHPRYEGEAAILLEAALHDGIAHPEKAQSDVNHSGNYRFELIKNVATETSTAADTSVLLIDAAPVFKALLDDLSEGVPVALIARWFHDAFVQIIVDMAEIIRATYDIAVVVLAGGVFMNRYLMQQSIQMLMARGFTVALNRDLPPNDASISYGQAVIGLQTQTKE